MAGKILITQFSSSENKFKTKVRRLYDIANILSSLQLIKKVFLQGKKPMFKWIGPKIEPLNTQAPITAVVTSSKPTSSPRRSYLPLRPKLITSSASTSSPIVIECLTPKTVTSSIRDDGEWRSRMNCLLEAAEQERLHLEATNRKPVSKTPEKVTMTSSLVDAEKKDDKNEAMMTSQKPCFTLINSNINSKTPRVVTGSRILLQPKRLPKARFVGKSLFVPPVTSSSANFKPKINQFVRIVDSQQITHNTGLTQLVTSHDNDVITSSGIAPVNIVRPLKLRPFKYAFGSKDPKRIGSDARARVSSSVVVNLSKKFDDENKKGLKRPSPVRPLAEKEASVLFGCSPRKLVRAQPVNEDKELLHDSTNLLLSPLGVIPMSKEDASCVYQDDCKPTECSQPPKETSA